MAREERKRQQPREAERSQKQDEYVCEACLEEFDSQEKLREHVKTCRGREEEIS